MNRNTIIALVALVIVLALGITEVIIINNSYDTVYIESVELEGKCKDKTLTTQEFQQFNDSWTRVREMSELFLPHLDIYEINMRIAEACVYIETEDYDMAYGQFKAISTLLYSVPNMLRPTWRHIL